MGSITESNDLGSRLWADRHPGSFVFRGSESQPLSKVNIGQLLDNQSTKFPCREALVSRWQQRRLTYQQFHEGSLAAAKSLLALGVRPKDRVVILAGNPAEFAQLYFAVGGIGAIFAIINPTFTPSEVISAIEFLEPKVVCIADRVGYRKNGPLITQLAGVAPRSWSLVQLLSNEKSTDDRLTWDEFVQMGNHDAHTELLTRYWAQCSPDDTLCIQFTSGTTGPRKAAMLSHRNLLNNAILSGQRLEYTETDVVCCCAPLYHCFALVCGITSAIAFGSSLVVSSDVFLAGSSLEAMAEERCTVIYAVPAMFQAMLDHPDEKVYSRNISLRTGVVAGSSLSDALITRLCEEFDLHRLAYGYGMTEASCLAFLTIPSMVSLLADHSSVGTLLPHTQARVVDEKLGVLPPGSPGELLLSGYSVFKGYYKNPEKSQDALIQDSNGHTWLRTGDLVRLDDCGRCTIIGRVKDMIKRGGENIFPRDIEQVLESHPEIAAAAVVGIPDNSWGEVVGAFIQRRTQDIDCRAEFGRKQLKMWLRSRLAPHKTPEHFFWLGEEDGVPSQLPINHSGKIMKAELRAVAGRLVSRNV